MFGGTGLAIPEEGGRREQIAKILKGLARPRARLTKTREATSRNNPRCHRVCRANSTTGETDVANHRY